MESVAVAGSADRNQSGSKPGIKAKALSPAASAHLDMVRGLAAIFVLTGHVRGLFFLDFKDVGGTSPLIRLVYALTGLGHEAVMVFFVLSGFFIGGSVLNTLGGWSWKRYLVNRFTRLYMVLIPALILTAMVDQVSMRMPGGHTFFDLPIPHFTSPHGRDSVPIFFGNLFFQQDILTPAFGSDSPLWSLANEFWYYLLFPMIALLIPRGRSGVRKALLGAGVCAIGWYVTSVIRIGFGVWLLGVAVHMIPVRRAPRWLLTAGGVGAALLFAAVLAADRVHRIPDGWVDPAVGLTFAIWLFFIVNAAPRVSVNASLRVAPLSSAYRSVSSTLSKCSYSVYAVHLPLVYLIRTSVPAGYWAPSWGTAAIGVAISSVVFLSGYGFSRITEAHTDTVRTRVFRALGRERASAAAASA